MSKNKISVIGMPDEIAVREVALNGPGTVTCTEAEIYHVCSKIEAHMLIQHRRPTFEQIMLDVPELTATELKHILKSKAIRERLRQRGIIWPKTWREETPNILAPLTPLQVMAIQIITDPTARGNLRARLDAVGISYSVYRNWMKNVKFKEAIAAIGEEMVNDNIAAVHQSVTKKALDGDIGAAKLFYEVSGRHDPMRQQSMDIQRLVGLLLEVITRHVTDVGTLSRINEGFTAVLSGDTPAITSEPNIIDAEEVTSEDSVPVENTGFNF